MKKLTQTQTQLIREALRSRVGRCYVTTVSGRGGNGAIVRKYTGHRQSDAACKLRDAGYLVFLSHDHSHDTNNGYQRHYTTSTWELTQAGRELATQLGIKPAEY